MFINENFLVKRYIDNEFMCIHSSVEEPQITTKAMVIPSLKSFIFSFAKVSHFFNAVSDDLENISNSNESDAKEYFDQMELRSEEVKERCKTFLMEMSQVLSDLGA